MGEWPDLNGMIGLWKFREGLRSVPVLAPRTLLARLLEGTYG